MLSIETCLKILNEKEKKYTPEQAEGIRKFLYEMSRIDYETDLPRFFTQLKLLSFCDLARYSHFFVKKM